MPHFYPIVLPGGKSLAGDSLGFHAYSLRIDNLTNQWLLEETSLAWRPPYSLGVCLRLYGTGVGIILNQAPVGQPQLAPVTGEQAVGVYSDQLRTEVAGTPVRQFSLVQTVSDLTQGAVPASPPVGITRMYAAPDGTIHYILSSGATQQLIDTSTIAANVATQPLGGDLTGTVNNGHVQLINRNFITAYDQGGVVRSLLGSYDGVTLLYIVGTTVMSFRNQANAQLVNIDTNGNVSIIPSGANLSVPNNVNAANLIATGYMQAGNGAASGTIYLGSTAYLQYNGTSFYLQGTSNANSSLTLGNGVGMLCATPLILNGDGTQQVAGGGGIIYLRANNYVTVQNYAGTTNVTLYCGSLLAQANSSVVGTLGASSSITGYNFYTARATSSAYAFQTGTSAAPIDQGYANSFINASSVDFKKNIKSIANPLAILVNPALRAVEYDQDWELPVVDGIRSDPVFGTKHCIGFVADEWLPHVPEIVAVDDNGKPEGMDYARVTALLWEGIREFITLTNMRLET